MTIATAFFVNGFFFFSEYSNEGELLSIYKRLFDLYSDSLSISYKELDAIHQSLSTISLLQEQQNAEAESLHFFIFIFFISFGNGKKKS